MSPNLRDMRAIVRNRARGTAFAPLYPVERKLTGDACVEALLRAGFRIRSRGNGIAILVRGASVVMVPDVDHIKADLLSSILRSSGVSREELEGHLAHHPKRSGFFLKAPGDAQAAPSSLRRRR
jgi:hypothetical protein